MTPSFEYIGRTKEGQAWDIKGLTIMMTEYVPMNRAKNKTTWCSGFDVAFEVTDVLAGPNANCGFGKFCPVNIEQGEDDGLLVVKATFDCSVVSKFDDEIPVWGEGKYIVSCGNDYECIYEQAFDRYFNTYALINSDDKCFYINPDTHIVYSGRFDRSLKEQEVELTEDMEGTTVTARLTWTKNA